MNQRKLSGGTYRCEGEAHGLFCVELGQLDRIYPMADFVDTIPLERALERIKGK